MKFASLFALLLSTTAFAEPALIVSQSPAKPISVVQKELTVQVKCRVSPAHVNPWQEGKYEEAFCDCGFTPIEANAVVEKAFPTQLKFDLPGVMSLQQSLNECGKPLNVTGYVIYTP